MTTIAVKPFVLKDVLFQVAADNYEAHVSQVQFDPTTAIQVWQGLTPTSVHTDTAASTWQGTLAYAQDWETPNSLSRYLYDHEGETITVIFKPRSGVGISWTAQIVIVPGSIGGTVNAFATASVTVGVKGKPVPSPSPVAKPSWALTIAGAPTGGTYALIFNGYATAPLAYNSTIAQIDAAIEAMAGVTGIAGVTVTGTASAFTVLFPKDVTMATSNALTGGTAPTITAA